MSSVNPTASGDLAEWGPSDRPGFSPVDWLWLVVVLGVPGLVLAALLSLTVGWVAGLVGAAIYGGLVIAWLYMQGRMALKSAQARPLQRSEAPRLFNVTEGLAGDLCVATPSLWVIASGEPNGFFVRTPSPILAVTQSLLDTYTRTELEGVVAHCLIRLQPKTMHRATLAGGLGEAAGPAGILGLDEIDARAAALTRYPIGLAGAVEKAGPRAGRRSSFWFVPSGGRHLSREDRAALLREL